MSSSDDAVVTAAAKIVSAYVSISPACETDELVDLIRRVGAALMSSVADEVPPEPELSVSRRRVSPKKAVSPDGSKVQCLECGVQMIVLRNHLNTHHGMTVSAYRGKWGQSIPVTAPAYSAKRSALAKSFGLGRIMPDGSGATDDV
jgi:predicted transcriptional regulator